MVIEYCEFFYIPDRSHESIPGKFSGIPAKLRSQKISNPN